MLVIGEKFIARNMQLPQRLEEGVDRPVAGTGDIVLLAIDRKRSGEGNGAVVAGGFRNAVPE